MMKLFPEMKVLYQATKLCIIYGNKNTHKKTNKNWPFAKKMENMLREADVENISPYVTGAACISVNDAFPYATRRPERR